MNYARDIHALRRYTLAGQAASILVFLFGAVSLVLFFDPSLVAVSVEQQINYRGHLIWLFVGITFLFLATSFLLVLRRWPRRLLWIWKNVNPEPMNLCITVDDGSDHTSYYALLSAEQAGMEEPAKWRVSLYSPSWDVAVLGGSQVPAKVFFDPESNTPAVIETDRGLLWRMAGSGSVSMN